jgi:hypothetical protein
MTVCTLVLFQARHRAWSAEPDVYKYGATPFWEFARWGDSLAQALRLRVFWLRNISFLYKKQKENICRKS